jgi:phosphatidylglycerophosphatase A
MLFASGSLMKPLGVELSIMKRTRVPEVPPIRLWEVPYLVTASFGGTGFFPLASGTVASLAACVLFVLLPPWPWLVLVLGAVLFLFGVPSTGWMARRYRDNDPSQATVDEGAVMLLVLALFPREWGYLAAAFVLFRLFDVVKLPPCRLVERLPGGWGIMLDDLVAGVYASVILLVVRLADLMPAWARTALPNVWF